MNTVSVNVNGTQEKDENFVSQVNERVKIEDAITNTSKVVIMSKNKETEQTSKTKRKCKSKGIKHLERLHSVSKKRKLMIESKCKKKTW